MKVLSVKRPELNNNLRIRDMKDGEIAVDRFGQLYVKRLGLVIAVTTNVSAEAERFVEILPTGTIVEIEV